MKKIIALLVFLAIANFSKASATFNLLNTVCDTNGTLVVSYTGFFLPPFHVQWQYGARTTMHTITGFSDTLRNYNGATITAVTLFDSVMAVIETDTFHGTLPLYFTLSSTNSVCPAQPTMSATVSGSSPLTYSWYNVATGEIVGTAATVTVPGSGIYGVWITTGTAGCGSGSSATGLYDTVTAAVMFSDTLVASTANCNNGKVKIDTIVGTYTPPLSYMWSNGASTDSITNLIAGTYYLTITDSNGCAYHASATVAASVSISVTTTSGGTGCSGFGTITAHTLGGYPPYSFMWSNGAITAFQPGVPAGSYTVSVTDSKGCQGTGWGNVNNTGTLNVTASATYSSCMSATGSVYFAISGGTAPYTDTLYASPIQTGIICPFLPVGTYGYKVVDAAGCVKMGYVTVPRSDSAHIDFVSSAATCTLSNGSVSAYVTGGTSPYTYSWNTGATTSSITGLSTGTYALTVTDGAGCSSTSTATVADFSTLSVSSATNYASCLSTADGGVTLNPAGGTPPYSYSWSNGSTSSHVSGLPTGPYWAYVTDASGCTAYSYNYVGYDAADSFCFCIIRGRVFNDNNVDCTQEPGEAGLPNMQVYCSGVGYAYTDDSGSYSFLVPSGTYTITETVDPYYHLSGCQMNNIPVTTVADTNCVHIINFSNTVDSINDLEISSWDFTQPIAGRPYTQMTIMHNKGTVLENGPVAAAKTDSQLFDAAFIPAGIYQNSPDQDYRTPYSGGLPSMAPGSSLMYLRNFNIPAYLSIGTMLNFYDTLAYIAPLDSWITDYDPTNNVYTLTTQVAASSPSNFKEVAPKGYGSNGVIPVSDSVLQYMIHFQNTGSTTAQNAVITDTLDNNLDWTTFRPIYTSAPCEFAQSNNGKVVKFTFNNIELPASNGNAFLGSCIILYSIKLKPGLIYGDQIRNTSSVYLDNHTPVRTNTTLNTIGWPLDVAKTTYTDDFVTVYPNPANDVVNVIIKSATGTGEATMTISDIAGHMLMNRSVRLTSQSQFIAHDVSSLKNGVYLVSLVADGKAQTKKLLILK